MLKISCIKNAFYSKMVDLSLLTGSLSILVNAFEFKGYQMVGK